MGITVSIASCACIILLVIICVIIYSIGLPTDSPCLDNGICKDDFCRDNGGGTRLGKCGKGKVGDKCGINSDCSNSSCGRATAADGATLACCASGKVHEYGGYDYCGGMASGSTCWSDAMCASDNCKGNAGGFKKGTCT